LLQQLVGGRGWRGAASLVQLGSVDILPAAVFEFLAAAATARLVPAGAQVDIQLDAAHITSDTLQGLKTSELPLGSLQK
jgi:hypothetical protein